MKPTKIRMQTFVQNWSMSRRPKRTKEYCSEECYNKEKHIRENKIYNAKQLARFNLPAGTHKMCQACPNPITEYGFHVACSQECHVTRLDERNRIQAQKKPCKRCGHDITRARYHKYCSDQMQVRGMARRQEKTSEKLKLQAVQKYVITDKKQLVYCTAECRLEHIREKYDEAHAEKSARNARPYWSTCVARIALTTAVLRPASDVRKNA